jgi:pimeloyl-ACP methyl ester carboxylesterase
MIGQLVFEAFTLRTAFVATACSALVAACQIPRTVPQSVYERCPPLSETQPTTSTLFITLRQPNCANGAVAELTDKRAQRPLYSGLRGADLAFYREDQWLSVLEQQAPDKSKPLILFIHGYRNTNAEALGVARKIREAAKEDEPVIPITWPSYGHYTSYFWDETNAEWASNEAVEPVLQIVSRYPHVIIIAHSMGNRIALALMSELRQRGIASHVDHLIMASPDVDRASVRQLLWNGVGTRVTIYGSRKDQALSGSWRLHSYPRAGDLSWWVAGRERDYSLAWIPDLEIIDTTDVDHSRIGHSAFIETREGEEDLCRVVHGAGSTRPDIAPVYPRLPQSQNNYFRLVRNPKPDWCSARVP